MSNITQNIKSYKVVYPQIYSYTLPELKPNEGSQKIGYTEQENVHDRILQQVKTAAFRLNYELLWSAPAFFKDSKESFIDKLFHKFLEKKGIERKWDLGQEWFYFNGEPLKSKDLFDLFRKEKFSALQNDNGKIDYTLRFEQNEAVEKAIDYFQKTKEDEIRDRLRSFTRTIPMFIMANDSKEEITIDNFDLEIDDNDFLELTSITKEEFYKLRDGFDYEEDGERKRFQGVFNKYRLGVYVVVDK